jgi:hypothetical protein
MPALLRVRGTGPAGEVSTLRAAKRRLVRPVTNRLINPLVRPLVKRGLLEPGRALLETRGRRLARGPVLDRYRARLSRLRRLRRPVNDVLLLAVGTEQLVIRIDLDKSPTS